jgi:hypothetical protein
MATSEIAELRQQIELACVAAFQGLHGLAQGVARHQIINARMERVGALQETLGSLVGEQEATRIVYEAYERGEQEAQTA